MGSISGCSRKGPRKAVLQVLPYLVGLLIAAQVGMAWLNAYGVPSNTKTTRYIVQPGDTEYQIAERFDRNKDPRWVVEWIDHTNGLDGQAIMPGQKIIVPVGR